MIIAAALVLVVQGSKSTYMYDGVAYAGYGWPAVSSSWGRDPWGANQGPFLPRMALRHSPAGYAINGLTLVAIVVLASMLDRLGHPEQFGMWRLFVIMLACSVILACIKTADAHNFLFLTGAPASSDPAP
jgi:hypothetical protein